MKIGHTIDSNGFWTGDVLEDSDIEPNVTVICPTEGFHKPKWNGNAWVEGLTQAEIDAIKNAPVPKTEVELMKEENLQLNNQIIDLWETLLNAGVL